MICVLIIFFCVVWIFFRLMLVFVRLSNFSDLIFLRLLRIWLLMFVFCKFSVLRFWSDFRELLMLLFIGWLVMINLCNFGRLISNLIVFLLIVLRDVKFMSKICFDFECLNLVLSCFRCWIILVLFLVICVGFFVIELFYVMKKIVFLCFLCCLFLYCRWIRVGRID